MFNSFDEVVSGNSEVSELIRLAHGAGDYIRLADQTGMVLFLETQAFIDDTLIDPKGSA